MGSIIEDHRRFKDIVRGRIKQNFKKYVTHGEMVGRQEKDLVKIPIPSIDIPRFRYGPKQQGGNAAAAKVAWAKVMVSQVRL